jgi:geranylgeranyl pyrophosphate synthase
MNRPPADAVSESFDLEGYLSSEAFHAEAALERALSRSTPDLPGDVAAAVAHGVMSGGKRLRPILFAAAYRAAGGGAEAEAVYDLAASLELIHAYSLMHDDLPCMDDADLRRGRPTTHKMHGEGVTMRAGAALIPLAAAQALSGAEALGLTPDEAVGVAALLMQAAGAGGMVGGQGLDLLGEERSLTAPELDELHRHKTGALLTAALTMGAAAARAPEAVRSALARYGEAVGLAFQIADDLLDATATAEELGKEPSDVELGKSTYVSLFGLEDARGRGDALIVDAKRALDEAGLDAPPLRALANFVMERRR